MVMLFTVTTALADQFESIDRLSDAARNFVRQNFNIEPGEQIEVSISTANNNIQVPQCADSIQVSYPSVANHDQISTVKMNCSGPQSWEIYVPVNVKLLTNVVVAKEPIPAKDKITAEMLDYAQADRNKLLSGYFKDVNQVAGQVATSTIPAGTIISKHNIQPATVIHRNQNVTIIGRTGSILVKAEGIAKSDGGINDIIKVMNRTSKRLLDAIVIDGATVEVNS